MNPESSINLQKRLAPVHLIAAALIAGVIMFAGVAMTIGPISSSASPSTAPTAGGITFDMPMMMRIVWATLAFMQIPIVFVIRNAMLNRAATIRRSDAAMLASAHRPRGIAGKESLVHEPTFDAFRNSSIFSFALLESVALIGAMAVMFSGDPIDLLLVAMPVLAMIVLFPTTGRWRNFDRNVQERAAVAR